MSSVSVYGKKPNGDIAGRALKHGGHTKTISEQECDANAAIIAAAPDLLAALEAILPLAYAYLKDAPTHPDNGKLADAGDALAKARGHIYG